MENKDALETCEFCGLDLVYVTKTIIDKAEFITKICLGCGYKTNSQFEQGSEYQLTYHNILPELMKDLSKVGEDGLVWYPTFINEPNRGILFPIGESIDVWGWAVMPSVLMSDEEIEILGTDQKYKSDPTQVKVFAKEDFSGALDSYNKL